MTPTAPAYAGAVFVLSAVLFLGVGHPVRLSRVLITTISAAATRPLRKRVLRPTLQLYELIYSGDDEPTSVHFGAVLPGHEGGASVVDGGGGVDSAGVAGIASLFNRPAPAEWGTAHAAICGGGAWQLRGMATAPEVRGSGIGGRLLEACINHATARSGAVFWCNARVGVRGFYERYGLRVFGETFDIAGVGPHFFMWRVLR